jgi:multiple sugar transport system permease protein
MMSNISPVTRTTLEKLKAIKPGKQVMHVRKIGWNIFIYGLLIILSCIFILPLLWMISSSLKPDYAVFAFPPQWIPNPAIWSNYVQALTVVPFQRFFLNTLIITVGSLIGSVISNVMIGYAFARLNTRLSNILFYIVISTMLLPFAVTMIPQYSIFANLKWIDTFWPLVIPSYFGNPFYIFLLRQFFRGVPRDFEDAAAIDGAGMFQTVVRVVLPLSWPVVITMCILQIQSTWNDFLGPLIYLNRSNLFTMQLGLQFFQGQYSGTWNLMMAASTVILIPIILIFYFGQKLFVKGIVVGGLKG